LIGIEPFVLGAAKVAADQGVELLAEPLVLVTQALVVLEQGRVLGLKRGEQALDLTQALGQVQGRG
jgi:hypothetical protein